MKAIEGKYFAAALISGLVTGIAALVLQSYVGAVMALLIALIMGTWIAEAALLLGEREGGR